MIDKKELEKEIERFKTKIYFELENHTKEVLIFGNDRIASTCGEFHSVMSKFASMIMQLSKQTGIKEKELLRMLKDMIKLYKFTYGGNNEQ